MCDILDYYPSSLYIIYLYVRAIMAKQILNEFRWVLGIRDFLSEDKVASSYEARDSKVL